MDSSRIFWSSRARTTLQNAIHEQGQHELQTELVALFSRLITELFPQQTVFHNPTGGWV